MKEYALLGIEPGCSAEQLREVHKQLVRRWHPDRFQEGPERMWAEKKMAEINSAYQVIKKGAQAKSAAGQASAQDYNQVRRLLSAGRLSAARQALLELPLRTAEWNYLFAGILARSGERKKAALYFSIAVHQAPENVKYRSAYLRANATESFRDSFCHKLRKRILGA